MTEQRPIWQVLGHTIKRNFTELCDTCGGCGDAPDDLSGIAICRACGGTGLGGESVETQTFEEFARSTIQDDLVAAEIAFKMLEGDGTYNYNAPEPEFCETFEIIDRDGLYAQLLRQEI